MIECVCIAAKTARCGRCPNTTSPFLHELYLRLEKDYKVCEEWRDEELCKVISDEMKEIKRKLEK